MDVANNSSLSYADRKMIQAFGVPLLNSEGVCNDDLWGKIWRRMLALKGKLYQFPGARGRQFISMLAQEVMYLGKGFNKSKVCV